MHTRLTMQTVCFRKINYLLIRKVELVYTNNDCNWKIAIGKILSVVNNLHDPVNQSFRDGKGLRVLEFLTIIVNFSDSKGIKPLKSFNFLHIHNFLTYQNCMSYN